MKNSSECESAVMSISPMKANRTARKAVAAEGLRNWRGVGCEESVLICQSAFLTECAYKLHRLAQDKDDALVCNHTRVP